MWDASIHTPNGSAKWQPGKRTGKRHDYSLPSQNWHGRWVRRPAGLSKRPRLVLGHGFLDIPALSQAGLHHHWPQLGAMCDVLGALCFHALICSLPWPVSGQSPQARIRLLSRPGTAYPASPVATLGARHHLPPHIQVPLPLPAVFCASSLSSVWPVSKCRPTGRLLTRRNPPFWAGTSWGQPS